MEPEGVALGLGECRAFVETWIIEQVVTGKFRANHRSQCATVAWCDQRPLIRWHPFDRVRELIQQRLQFSGIMSSRSGFQRSAELGNFWKPASGRCSGFLRKPLRRSDLSNLLDWLSQSRVLVA